MSNITRIKFYAHQVFPNTKDTGDMFRAIDIVTGAVETVSKVFKGTIKYDGDGSETVQYSDVVEFETLSEVHKEAILRNYPFASVKLF
jgi:hypothetical protein